MRKPNVLVPMAGLGSRFQKEGFTVPKQLINVRDKHLIDLSLACLDLKNCNLIFIIRDDHIYNFRMNEILQQKFGSHVQVVVLDHLTRGSVESCLHARKYIDNDEPLIIHTLDIEFSPKFDPHTLYDLDADGILLTFQSNSPNYSYARLEGDYVKETAEKKSISSNACVGIYGFKRGSDFCFYANQMIQQDIRTNNEFYIAPLYNLLINDNKKIIASSVEKMHVFGTPEEFYFYKKNVIKRLGDKPIALCADHSGFQAKEETKKILTEMQLPFIDFGTIVDRECNYKDYIGQATKAIIEGECDFAFGFCRTGQGVNICANKFKGVRSALIYDSYAMEMAIRHNCANFFAIPTKHFGSQEIKEFLAIALSTTFDGGRHQIRVQEIE
jgi:RpiB/LacA/LacB family sugar-phosphate isomerase